MKEFLVGLLIAAIITSVSVAVWQFWPGREQPSEEEQFPEEGVNVPSPPELYPPEPVTLPELIETFENVKIEASGNINACLFENCILEVWGENGIKITNSKFVNSKIHMGESQNIEISNNIIKDFYVHEEAAISIYSCDNLLIDHNEIENNSIGIAISESSDVEICNNIFEANDQHNALMGDSLIGAEIHNNLFRYNFPHAMMIMNRGANPKVQLDIYNNIVDKNIEDAINFEDFRGSQQISRVYNNRITGTGLAGINVEYNSWGANLVIENNYIDNNGLLTDDMLDGEGHPTSIYPAHSHQPEPYAPGWKHGVKLEDCSGIIVKGNVIVNNQGNGVDVKNGRNITLENNIITKNAIGVSLMKFLGSSLYREFSPLAPEDAGHSEVIAIRNSVFGNLGKNYFVEEGSSLKTS